MKKPLLVFVLLLVLALSSAGCRLYGPCDWPSGLKVENLIGTWVAVYSGHYVSDPVEGALQVTGTTTYLINPGATPMPIVGCGQPGPSEAWERCSQLRGPSYPLNGTERVQIHADGTYTHSFTTTSFNYRADPASWNLVVDAPEGPKVVMERMRYFAAGVTWGVGYVPMLLGPQTADGLRGQAAKERLPPGTVSPMGIMYPTDQKLYLYPRICGGKLSLVQMILGPSDPDNLVVQNPVFTRQGP
jgi:hypothetical protein